MNRCSRITEQQILALHFLGYSRDSIAVMVGVSPATVSEVIVILPESLTSFRELSVELKKQNLSVFEAKKAAERARVHPHI